MLLQNPNFASYDSQGEGRLGSVTEGKGGEREGGKKEREENKKRGRQGRRCRQKHQYLPETSVVSQCNLSLSGKKKDFKTA